MHRRAFLTATAASSLLTASAGSASAQAGAGLAAAQAYSVDHGGVSFLVARHGVLLAEHYAAGGAATRWPIGEGTRAFTALLAATLVEDDLLTLDEPVALTIGDWGADPVKASISIRALLGGVSGVAFPRRGAHTLAAAIVAEPVEPPGVRFIDDALPYVLFAEIARRKLVAAREQPRGERFTETDPARYLTGRTLLPIGCVPISWTRGPDAAALFDDGAALSARAWAQAGELIRRQGVWRARQLADDDTLREAVRGSFAEARAGFGLWIAAPNRSQRELPFESDLWSRTSPAPLDLAIAAGAGGQRLYFSPTEGVVIVRQARGPQDGWSDAQFLTLVWRGL